MIYTETIVVYVDAKDAADAMNKVSTYLKGLPEQRRTWILRKMDIKRTEKIHKSFKRLLQIADRW